MTRAIEVANFPVTVTVAWSKIQLSYYQLRVYISALSPDSSFDGSIEGATVPSKI